MKFGTKIFFYSTIFFSIAFLFGGYTLISYFHKIIMEREVEGAIEQYQYNKFVLQANLITKGEDWFADVADGMYDMNNVVSDMSDTVAFFTLEGAELYSGFPTGTDITEFRDDIVQDYVNYYFQKINGRTHLLVMGIITQGDTSLYLVTGVDVENVMEQQEQIIKKFANVYAVIVGIGMLLILGLSVLLIRPIKRLTIATQRIAAGTYKERVEDTGEDEVGQLARNFNQMACAVEEKINELSDSAKQKEDFVANFAHELKTPLTSIIGYANRIYQKELTREEQKRAAWYIWNEGMRLESLALKLMDLTNLNHKEFTLQQVRSDELFQELASDVEYFLEDKGVLLDYTMEQAYIEVEYDLFQSLFINIIDNAVKAGAKHIKVTGHVEGTEKHMSNVEATMDYIIQIEDNGNGIPQCEIMRITEAFYMVDKSRSRKQHGAGIGLALSEKIAQIHGSKLEFESDGKSWTKVRLRIKCKGVKG